MKADNHSQFEVLKLLQSTDDQETVNLMKLMYISLKKTGITFDPLHLFEPEAPQNVEESGINVEDLFEPVAPQSP